MQRTLSLQVSKNFTLNILILVVIFLSSALISFIAANWSSISTFGRFMIVQGSFVAFTLVCIGLSIKYSYYLKMKSTSLTWLSFSFTILSIVAIGGLFALIGQTYQTGADAWQLFALWSALALPWAIFHNKPLVWLLWLVILNLTLMLFSAQVLFVRHQALLLPAVINLILYICSVRVLNRNWLSYVLLGLCQFFFILSFFIKDYFTDSIAISIILIGAISLAIEIYTRRDPISFIFQVFFILLLVNIILISNLPINNWSFIILIMAISSMITTALFFSYLRHVYIRWRKDGIVFSDALQLSVRRIMTVCRMLLGWLIGLTSTAAIMKWIGIILPEGSLVYIIPILMVGILFFKMKILSEASINQISSILIYLFLSFYFAGELVDYLGFSGHDALLGFYMVVVIYFSALILFIIDPAKISRVLSSVTMIVMKLMMITTLLAFNFDISTEIIIASDLGYFVIILTYIIVAFIIYSYNNPRAKIFRIKPLSLVPVEAWWLTLLLISIYQVIFINYDVVNYTTAVNQVKVWRLINLFYVPLPLFTAFLLWLNHRLPQEKRFLMLIFILSAASYFILPYFGGINYLLTLILLSVALNNRILLVLGWIFGLSLLHLHYYSTDYLLIDKAFSLFVTAMILLVFGGLFAYFYRKAKANTSHTQITQPSSSAEEIPDELSDEAGVVSQEIKPSKLLKGILRVLQLKKSRTLLAILGLVIPLVIANTSIMAYEHILSTGNIIRLEMEPADPRSLMQGDYMSITYTLENEIRSELNKLDDAQKVNMIYAHYTLDEKGVARLQSISSDKSADNLTLRFKLYYDTPILYLSHDYFFEEGNAMSLEKAKYAEFRVNPQGKAVITALLDMDFTPLISAQP